MAVKYTYKQLLDQNFDKVFMKVCEGFKANKDVKMFYICRQLLEMRDLLRREGHSARMKWHEMQEAYKKENKEASEMPTEVFEQFLETEYKLPDKYNKF